MGKSGLHATVARFSYPGEIMVIPIVVTEGDNEIARIEVKDRVILVGGEPIEVAWFEKLLVEDTYRNLGFGASLFATAKIAASREYEWGALYSDEEHLAFFNSFGFFSPPDATDNLLVGPLSGLPQEWPRGEILV
jgi:GNAT superfamily N-acetyltransferase